LPPGENLDPGVEAAEVGRRTVTIPLSYTSACPTIEELEPRESVRARF
jgi:hypothetical protein